MAKRPPTALVKDLIRIDQDAEDVAAAARHYADFLRESAAKDAHKAGKDEVARKWENEADGIEEELVKPWEEHRKRPVVYERHLHALRIGIPMLVKRLRSIQGTAKGLGKYRYEGAIAMFEEHAQFIETGLLARIAEEPELPLTKQPDAPPAKVDPANLKLMVDAEVDEAELEEWAAAP